MRCPSAFWKNTIDVDVDPPGISEKDENRSKSTKVTKVTNNVDVVENDLTGRAATRIAASNKRHYFLCT